MEKRKPGSWYRVTHHGYEPVEKLGWGRSPMEALRRTFGDPGEPITITHSGFDTIIDNHHYVIRAVGLRKPKQL